MIHLIILYIIIVYANYLIWSYISDDIHMKRSFNETCPLVPIFNIVLLTFAISIIIDEYIKKGVFTIVGSHFKNKEYV